MPCFDFLETDNSLAAAKSVKVVNINAVDHIFGNPQNLDPRRIASLSCKKDRISFVASPIQSYRWREMQLVKW